MSGTSPFMSLSSFAFVLGVAQQASAFQSVSPFGVQHQPLLKRLVAGSSAPLFYQETEEIDPSAFFMMDDDDGDEIDSNDERFSLSGCIMPGYVATLTEDQLKLEQNNANDSKGSSSPLLVEVYAPWCGPCKMIAPELKAAAQELGDSCRVAKIDCEAYPDWAAKHKIQGLPTVLLFSEDGTTEVNRLEGAFGKEKIMALVDQRQKADLPADDLVFQ